jgi:trehalose/maltose hydrolase-like predicted phosphorylase
MRHPREARGPQTGFILTTTDPCYRIPGFIGNGVFSLVSTPLGTTPAESFAAGVYDHSPGDVPRIAVLPAWNVFNVGQGTAWLNDVTSRRATIRSYRQSLDMHCGTLHTAYEWMNGSMQISIELTAFVSRADPHLAVIRLQLVPHQAGRLTVTFGFHEWPPPQRLALERIEQLPADQPRDALWYPGQLLVRQRLPDALLLEAAGRGTTVAIVQAVPDPRGGRNLRRDVDQVSFDGSPGKPVSLTKLVGVATSRDSLNPLAPARASVERAIEFGYRAVRSDHAAAWKRLWSTDIVVDGDAALQRVVRTMQFYLLSSIREDAAESIAPMGLSSAGFYGHIFWDADTWMFPVLAVTHPEVARSIVAFRFRTMVAAQQNARTNGFRGAMYPWEADEEGEETTPRFAQQNARSEIHITGDVGLAQWQFFLVTGDREWLWREGYRVIRETAEFWVSRVTYDAATNRYRIRRVVSVDESLIGIDDDAYTNAVARRNLEVAIAASLELGVEPDPRWARIAAALSIPYDAASERHRTFENAPPETKSSAVPLLAYPLALPMSDDVKRNDLMHTVKQLESRPRRSAMMSHVLYPVVAAELDDQALVDRLVRPSYEGHLRPPFDAIAERPIDDAVNFVTGAGAFLQQVIFGYTGLRLTADGLAPVYKPTLPAGIRRIVLRNFFSRGTTLDIVVDRGRARFAPKAVRPRRYRASSPTPAQDNVEIG